MRPRVINYSRPEYIRDIMIRNGDADKPMLPDCARQDVPLHRNGPESDKDSDRARQSLPDE